MCLITNKKIKIAKKDITVYKIVHPDLKSEIQEFQYEIGVLYQHELSTTKKDTEIVYYCVLDNAYINKHFPNYRNLIKDGKLTCYKKGFHSSLKKEILMDSNINNLELSIVECTIPKGSEYVEDFVGFCVSNQIIINKIIKL